MTKKKLSPLEVILKKLTVLANGTFASKAELTQATIIPVDIDKLTPSSTFIKNNILFINGVGYRAVRNTREFPVVLLVEDGHIVYDEDENGNIAFVVEDYTLSQDWEKWTDAGIPRTLQLMTDDQNTFMANERAQMAEFKQEIRNDAARLIALAAASIKPSTKFTSSSGAQYTAEQLLQAMTELMDKRVVADPITE